MAFGLDLRHRELHCLDDALDRPVGDLELLVDVKPRAAQEASDRDRHGACGDGEAQSPARGVLDVGHDGVPQEAATADAKVPPLEEEALLVALPLLCATWQTIFQLQLICSKRL